MHLNGYFGHEGLGENQLNCSIIIVKRAWAKLSKALENLKLLLYKHIDTAP
jgi:hypothetical protein